MQKRRQLFFHSIRRHCDASQIGSVGIRCLNLAGSTGAALGLAVWRETDEVLKKLQP